MSLYRVTLQFTGDADAPQVTGEWTREATTRNKFRSWIGLYGSVQSSTIRFVEEADDGSNIILDTWPTPVSQGAG